MLKDDLKSFTADIELKPEFRKVPQVVAAKVSYAIDGGSPMFHLVEVDGETIPLERVSLSSLLEAFRQRKPHKE